MTTAQAAETIRRVEKQMISEMTAQEYDRYMQIPEDERKAMLYVAFKVAGA